MTDLASWGIAFLQLAFFVLVAPAILGLLRWLKARLQLRQGAPVGQCYWDLAKLWRKGPGPQPEPTSWVHAATPYVVFGACALLVWAIPPVYCHVVWIDLLGVVYLLGLARFALALAGMDTGTPFAGMGSSREMFVNVLAEPALVLIVCALIGQRIPINLVSILSASDFGSEQVFALASLLLLWGALALVAVMETGRLPVDNPATHLELTMIERALHLEYSGRNLALIEWAEALKLTFFLSLLGDLLWPQSSLAITTLVGPGWPLGVYLLKLIVGAGLLALVEALLVKIRLRHIVWPAALATTLALIAMITVIVTATPNAWGS